MSIIGPRVFVAQGSFSVSSAPTMDHRRQTSPQAAGKRQDGTGVRIREKAGNIEDEVAFPASLSRFFLGFEEAQ